MSIYRDFSENEITILQERAERVAQDNTAKEVQETIAALVVMLQSDIYALPVEQIVTIYEDVPIIPVPSVPSHIRGIANLRGHITPVIDLGILLDVENEGSEIEKHYLIVVSHKNHTAAFFVEQVSEILDFSHEDISGFDSQTEEEQNPYLQGILRSGQTLINTTKILSDPHLRVTR